MGVGLEVDGQHVHALVDQTRSHGAADSAGRAGHQRCRPTLAHSPGAPLDGRRDWRGEAATNAS